MIGYLKGNLVHKQPTHVIIEASGVGYLVHIPLSTYYAINEKDFAELQIHTRVREDQISLYGFITLEEKEIFEKLTSVTGIGPKVALTILSGLPLNELYDVIERQDARRLTNIPGIGSKTSERIILEMKDKIKKKLTDKYRTSVPSVSDELKQDLINALVNLGYNQNESKNTVDRVMTINASKDFVELLKESLRILTRT
ncbi:MAG: Holliday junction DNA helicase RuvA [Candidatus Fischerbacteria bacterium RBG_13_37_8]|uniref:Holliday junction branch migration complex subunit RuvA n=1 Tax=Candidatus Fischerbacteria bacterium RBG_13_37_8 TaxID=1817863 RepID=A0A1F5VJ44_9BACT|nr:MAG: Holliday junction DNA helicase RuvA [Candidatus Fischerbacteria bacterium RBG_13_37_8]